MNALSVIKVAAGLALLILGVWAILAWWQDLITVVKGCTGLFMVSLALIILAIARE